MDPGESAVTPVIGTILVLAVAVAGIGVAILVGAPVLQRMQEQAALEATVAQFQQLRAGAGRLAAEDSSTQMGVSLPGGDIGIASGTHVMVTTYVDAARFNCDLRFLEWEDGDNHLAYDYDPTNCRIPAVPVLLDATACGGSATGTVIINGESLVTPDLACLEAYKSDDFGNLGSNLVALSLADCPPTGAYGICAAGFNVAEDVGPNDDWRFMLTNGETDPGARKVYLDAWLLHTDRLTWERGGVAAYYELGAIFSKAGRSVYMQAEPAFGEQTPGAGGPEFLLRLPTWQNSISASLAGTGVYGLQVSLGSGHVRTADPAEGLRIDFQGDLASAWCQALLLRDVGYTEDDDALQGDPTRTCDPEDPSSDLVRGLLYDLDSATPARVLQQVFHGELQV